MISFVVKKSPLYEGANGTLAQKYFAIPLFGGVQRGVSHKLILSLLSIILVLMSEGGGGVGSTTLNNNNDAKNKINCISFHKS